MSNVPVEKHEDTELPIPTIWRATLKSLGDSFVFGTQLVSEDKVSIEPIDEETTKINRSNIEDYPDTIGRLTEITWVSSVCAWTGNSWEVLVDLSTSDGQVSDLVMHVEIRETGDCYIIEPGLIYVP